MSFNFLNLPLDIQKTIIPKFNISSIGKVCQTNKVMKKLCCNEQVWKTKFIELTQIEDHTFALSWVERVRLIWSFIHSETAFTLHKNPSEENLDPSTAKVLGVYYSQSTSMTITEAEVKTRSINEYNLHNDPIYSELNITIDDTYKMIDRNKRYMDPDTLQKSVEFKTLTSKRNVINDKVLRYLINSSIIGLSKSIIINFTSDNNKKTFHLYKSSDVGEELLLTILGTEERQIFEVLAIMINFRHICFEKISHIIKDLLYCRNLLEENTNFKSPTGHYKAENVEELISAFNAYGFGEWFYILQGEIHDLA